MTLPVFDPVLIDLWQRDRLAEAEAYRLRRLARRQRRQRRRGTSELG
jgi:hypothetical protein